MGTGLAGRVQVQGTRTEAECGQWVRMHSRAGGDVHIEKGTLFLTDVGITVFMISGHLNVRCGFVCVCMCVFLILEWIMRCKENSNYSDFYSNLYRFLYQRNLLRTFIFKIQKCFKVLMSN